jgi:hypothetical protein
MRAKVVLFWFTWMVLLTFGCTRHEVQVAPVEVKPIHITIDVNVRVDRALDDFFGDLDEAEETLKEDSAGDL